MASPFSPPSTSSPFTGPFQPPASTFGDVARHANATGAVVTPRPPSTYDGSQLGPPAPTVNPDGTINPYPLPSPFRVNPIGSGLPTSSSGLYFDPKDGKVKVAATGQPVTGQGTAPKGKSVAVSPNDSNIVLNAIKNGKNAVPPSTGAGAGDTVDPNSAAYQQFLNSIGQINKTDFSVPYQTVTADTINPKDVNYVQPDLISSKQLQNLLINNPFGPKGYQPPAQYEQGLSNAIQQGQSQDYLQAFLPQAIAAAQKLYGSTYAPEIAAQLAAAAQQQNTIAGYNRGANELLSQIPGQVGNAYNQSIGIQQGIDKGIQSTLAGLNPGDQGALPPGSPAGAQQVINNQNNQSFNGAGAVLSGEGALNANALAQQRASAVAAASQLPYLNTFAGRQALVANGIGNSNALAKLLTSQAKDVTAGAEKIAGSNLSANEKNITTNAGLLKQQQDLDAKYLSQQLGIETHNQSTETSVLKGNQSATTTARGKNATIANDVNKFNVGQIQKAATTNASSALRAASIADTRRSQALAQAKFAFSIYKAMNPTASTAQQASQAKYIDSYGATASGLKPGPLVRVPTIDPKTGKQAVSTTGVPEWHTENGGTRTYLEAVNGIAPLFGGNTKQAEAAMSVYYNYGQGGRPFDSYMQEALQQAGEPTTIFHDTQGQPYISTAQLAALAKVNPLFAAQVYKANGNKPASPVAVTDAVSEGLIPQADAGRFANGVNVWIIPSMNQIPTGG